MIEGGFERADCQQLLAAFTADGTVDYFSRGLGGSWATVSYLVRHLPHMVRRRTYSLQRAALNQSV